MEEKIRELLVYIGENPDREGLVETPARVLRSWQEIFAGYHQDAKEVFTVFENTDNCDQIVLLKDVEFYSMCEHHMLPFYGKMHIAYLPDKKIVGISKLARLADVYTRRLQIQERIGEQITSDMMQYLSPKGAACVIEGIHLCMRMRGVTKQNSLMVTSSLKGMFLEDGVKDELMKLLK